MFVYFAHWIIYISSCWFKQATGASEDAFQAHCNAEFKNEVAWHARSQERNTRDKQLQVTCDHWETADWEGEGRGGVAGQNIGFNRNDFDWLSDILHTLVQAQISIIATPLWQLSKLQLWRWPWNLWTGATCLGLGPFQFPGWPDRLAKMMMPVCMMTTLRLSVFMMMMAMIMAPEGMTIATIANQHWKNEESWRVKNPLTHALPQLRCSRFQS